MENIENINNSSINNKYKEDDKDNQINNINNAYTTNSTNNADKKLTRAERYKMFLEISKYEPLTWTKNHYMIRVYTNLFCIGLFTLFIMKNVVLRYDIFTPKTSKYKLEVTIKFISMVGIIAALEYVNYNELEPYIYDKHYKKLSDKEFNFLYDSTVSKKLFEEEAIKYGYV